MIEANGHQMQARKNVLFFSRGQGRGHAIPDVVIAEEILKLDSSIDITFVSYGVGAETLRELSWEVIDLRLSEGSPLWECVVHITRILKEKHPILSISHEEFAVAPMSMALGIPSVFLTDWFLNEEWLHMQCLQYATEVIFMDEPGYFNEPSYLHGKIHYTDSVFRRLNCDSEDRASARIKLNLPQSCTVITVVPGGSLMHGEARAPLFDVAFGAFRLMSAPQKQMLWITGNPDYDALTERTLGRDNISIIKPLRDFTTVLMASDLVITKGNRTPLMECEILGVPSISISSGQNPVDDLRIARIPTNTALRLRGLNAETLRNHIERSLSGKSQWPTRTDRDVLRGGRLTAQRLYSHIESAAYGSAMQFQNATDLSRIEPG